MATRFIELSEAATMLGLTPDQLNEMRSNGEIHGYRDGASWKFKIEEVERVKGELASGGGQSIDDEPMRPMDMEDDASVLVTDEAAGPHGDGTPSKVIGKSGDEGDADSDLMLSGTSDLNISVDSDVKLVPGAGSDMKLVPDTGSDKSLKAPPGLAADVLGDSQLKLQSSDSGGTGGGTNRGFGSGLGSDDLDIALDSELALSDDDDMVLSGSGAGSDLTLNPAADSGINLASPSDSGLSLEADSGIHLQTPTDSGLSLEEDAVDMGGSSISALELPEDEAIELEAEPAANLKKDEEFLLSPSDEMFTDESDSGSQVIALEDSAAFDQDAALAGAAGGLLADAGMDQQLDSLGGLGISPTPTVSPAYARGGIAEEPYTVWNIMGLVSILLVLSLTGVLMFDIMNNMWSWDGGLDVSSSISDGITKAVFSSKSK